MTDINFDTTSERVAKYANARTGNTQDTLPGEVKESDLKSVYYLVSQVKDKLQDSKTHAIKAMIMVTLILLAQCWFAVHCIITQPDNLFLVAVSSLSALVSALGVGAIILHGIHTNRELNFVKSLWRLSVYTYHDGTIGRVDDNPAVRDTQLKMLFITHTFANVLCRNTHLAVDIKQYSEDDDFFVTTKENAERACGEGVYYLNIKHSLDT